MRVAFKAGLCFKEGTVIKPDSRKGTVEVFQADGLIHFCWTDRTKNELEEESLIFPEEAEFVRIGPVTNRVYMLKFLSSDRRLFFWMQETDVNGDAEICSQVNALLKDKSILQTENEMMEDVTASLDTDAAMIDQDDDYDDGDDDSMQGADARSSIMDAISAVMRNSSASSSLPVSSTTPSATSVSSSSATSAFGGINFQTIVDNVRRMQETGHAQTKPVKLENVIKVDALVQLISSSPEVLRRLTPHLPNDLSSSTALETDAALRWRTEEVLRSSQFHQALAMLTAAFQSGELGPLMMELGLDANVGGPLGGVEAFLLAMQQKIDSDQKNAS